MTARAAALALALLLPLGTGACSLWHAVTGSFGSPQPEFMDDLDAASLTVAIEHTVPIYERQDDHAAIAAARVLAAALERDSDPAHMRAAVNRHFRVRRIARSVLLTGYYAPELPARETRDAEFRHPIHARPEDLVRVRPQRFAPGSICPSIEGRVHDGELVAYQTRGEIDAGALDGRGLELAWSNDALDLFLLHVQGSGRLRFADDRVTGVHFAGTNGRPYRSLAAVMIERGLLTRDAAGVPSIRQALARLPEDQQRALMAANERYVFFALGDDPIRGSLTVPLTAGRSVATDPARVPPGALLYLETPSFSRFVVSQDTGAAIKGERADLFVGHGRAAGEIAGRLKEHGVLWMLEPRGPTPP